MKPKVAFFDFACCEGCQLQVANLEEDVVGLVNLVDVVEFREVMTGRALEYDVAFVEGSITRPGDEERLKEIRKRAKLLVALGSCAVSGGINQLKNLRGNLERVRKEVYGESWDLPHLDSGPVKAVDEVVQVDAFLPGCPIPRREFLDAVKSLVMGQVPRLPEYPVCVECKLKENVCLFEQEKACLGPVTRAGCDAACPTNGAPCDGCRGAVPHPNRDAMRDVLKENGVSLDRIYHLFTLYPLEKESPR